jgi:hypothetical protein
LLVLQLIPFGLEIALPQLCTLKFDEKSARLVL